MIEYGWYAGLKIAFTFSWKLTTPPHSRNFIIVDKGTNRKIWWMFMSAASSGCSSSMQVAVGTERDMECHIETHNLVPWGSFSIQQESAGSGTYYARLYSHALGQIVAEHSFNVTTATMPGLANDTG